MTTRVNPKCDKSAHDQTTRLLVNTSRLNTSEVLTPSRIITMSSRRQVIANGNLYRTRNITRTRHLLLTRGRSINGIQSTRTLLRRFFLTKNNRLFFRLKTTIGIVLGGTLITTRGSRSVNGTKTSNLLRRVLGNKLICRKRRSLKRYLNDKRRANTGAHDQGGNLNSFFRGSSPVFSFCTQQATLFDEVPVLHRP